MSSFLKAGIGLLVVFMALLLIETRGVFLDLDPQITLFFQNLIPRTFDLPFSIFSLLGSFELTSLIVATIAILVFHRSHKIFYSLVFFGVILIFEFIGKLFLYHPGPTNEYFRFILPFNLPSSHVQTGYSFPSGHVSRTAYLAVLGMFFGRTKPLYLGICGLVLSLMVISRIYLGEHWASDVVGGLFLGGSMGLLTLAYYGKRY